MPLEFQPVPAAGGDRVARPRRYMGRRLVFIAILLFGIAASAGASMAVWDWQSQLRTENFTRLAQERTQSIRTTLATTMTTVHAIRGLFDASSEVDSAEFRAFVRSLEVSDSVQALEWVPSISHALRDDFEQAARRDGFRDFEITERAGPDSMVRAADRDRYYPVYFVEPYDDNAPVLGYDLGSNRERLAALNAARDGGEAVATSRVTLVQETGEQFGFLIFLPIYRDGVVPETVSSRRADHVGFSLGVFRIGDLIASAMSNQRIASAPVDIHIFDLSDPAGSQRLYPASSTYETGDAVQASLRYEEVLAVAGRQWLLVATPVEGANFGRGPITSWLILLLGTVMTGLVAMSFKAIAGRADYARQEVALRTDELVRSNSARDDILVKLTKSNEELESFAYVASHDLKSPLRGIDNLVSWIVEDTESSLSAESLRNAERLRIRVNRLEALLDGLLEFSRAGRLKSTSESVDTRRLCVQIGDYLAPDAGVGMSYATDLPTIETARPALETVLRNLIGNAIKHRDGDTVNIAVTAEDRGSVYRFTVRDDGPGIDPAHHDRIFEIFRTLVPRSKTDTSGIGLSIVKRLVDAAGGSIHVESDAQARGVAFHFTWPKNWPGDGD